MHRNAKENLRNFLFFPIFQARLYLFPGSQYPPSPHYDAVQIAINDIKNVPQQKKSKKKKKKLYCKQ